MNRTILGRKGVGRFALEKLGKKVKIISKPIGTKDKFSFLIDWKKYEIEGVTVDTIPIEIISETRLDENDSGLEIMISELNDTWNKESITDFMNSLKTLILPKQLQSKNPFVVYLDVPYFDIKRQKIETNLEEKAFFYLEAELNEDSIELHARKCGSKYHNDSVKEIKSFRTGEDKKASEFSCGPVKLFVSYFPTFLKGDELRKDYYDLARKYYGEKFHDSIPTILDENQGVKIYKDGLREFKYGDKSHEWTLRDVITRGLSGTVQANRLIGFCMITSEKNPLIIPTTNRLDAINNEAYKDLQDFVISSMLWLDRKISNERRAKFQVYNENIKPTSRNLQTLETNLLKPQITKAMQQLEEELGIELNIIPIIKEAKKLAVEKERGYDESITQDQITLSNAALGDYLTRIYHDFVEPITAAVEDSLTQLIAFTKRKGITDGSELKKIAVQLSENWTSLSMIFDAIDDITSGLGIEEFYQQQKSKIALKEKIDDVCNGIKLLFEYYDFELQNKVSSKLELNIFAPVIHSLLYNLLSNSIKTFRSHRKNDEHGNFISVMTKIDKKNLIIFFSDNSTKPIPKNRWDTVFSERITSTSKEKILPEHGIGLYIIRRMLDHIQGSIEIINPIFGIGTTFKIELPKEYIAQD